MGGHLGSARDQRRAQPVPAWDPAGFRARVQAALDTFLDERANGWLPSAPMPPGVAGERDVGLRRQAVPGGLLLWGFHAVAGSTHGDDGADDALVRACASLELLHASALVHYNDYMDASDAAPGPTRPPTAGSRSSTGRRLARRPGAVRRVRGDPARRPAAELVRRAVRRCGLPLDRVVPALDVFDRCRSEVITGQFLDVPIQAEDPDVDAAMTVLRYKSAKYSVERPLHIGATLAGGSRAQLAQLGAFGLPLIKRYSVTTNARASRRPVDDRQAGRGRPDRGRAPRCSSRWRSTRHRQRRRRGSTPLWAGLRRRAGGGASADHR